VSAASAVNVTLAAMMERVDGLRIVSGDGRTKKSQNGYNESHNNNQRQEKFCKQNRITYRGNSRNRTFCPIR
jgi:hypothetical protein